MTRGAALALALAACRPASVPAPPETAAVFGPVLPSRLDAVLATDRGDVHCVLEPRHAPHAAALFAGLARGDAWFVDARTGRPARRPYYDAMVFHRRISSVLVQSGCPRGDGTGTPGYRIALEPRDDDAARLAVPGALFMATYTPPGRSDPAPPPPGHVVGSQFVVALVAMAHLAGRVTVLGACGDLGVVRALAAVPRESPPPRLLHVVVR